MNILNDYEIVINEMQDMNYEIYGVQNYKTISKVIMNILPNSTKYKVRKTFHTLIELKFIIRIHKTKRYAYIFLNENKRLNPNLFTVSFDY